MLKSCQSASTGRVALAAAATPTTAFQIQHRAPISSVANLNLKQPCAPRTTLNPRTSLRMSSEAVAEEPKGTGTASIPVEIFNLVKSIVGAGVLSLPAGECVTILAF